jgi:hypothetical protein
MFGFNQNNNSDPRVASALNNLDIKYTVDSDGDYRIVYNLSNGRTQMGFIRSNTYKFAGIEMREIFSYGLLSVNEFGVKISNYLLRENTNKKIGSWGIERSGDKYAASFTAKISSDLKGDALVAVIIAVLNTADELERGLTGKDIL